MDTLFLIEYPVEVGNVTMMSCMWILNVEGDKVRIEIDTKKSLKCFKQFEETYSLRPRKISSIPY